MNESRNSVPTSRSELGTRISEISKLVGGKKKLADMTGLSESQLYRYINGTSNPTVEPLVAIAEAAEVSIAWLATGEGPMRPGDLSDAERRREDIYLAEAGDRSAAQRVEERFQAIGGDIRAAGDAAKHAAKQGLSAEDIELVRTVAFAIPNDPDFVETLTHRLSMDAAALELSQEFALIPGYSVQVAAGAGALPGAEQPSRKLAFRRKWLRFRGLNEKDLVLVFAKGDSMEPTISDNNTLMIDTSQKDLSDGSIYVIRVNSHLVVKRVQTMLNRDIMLFSDNEAYRPETLKPEQLQDLEVIGRVVWIGKDV